MAEITEKLLFYGCITTNFTMFFSLICLFS